MASHIYNQDQQERDDMWAQLWGAVGAVALCLLIIVVGAIAAGAILWAGWRWRDEVHRGIGGA
jgi:hypothetical protein